MNIRYRCLYCLGIIITTLLIFGACQASKGVSKQQSWSIDLKKHGCLDACQSYYMLIESSRTYKYRGHYMVKVFGSQAGQISKKKLKNLKKLIASIDWLALQDTYGNSAEDSQQKELTFTSDTISKSIRYTRLEPLLIRELESYIDEIINSDDF